MAKHLALGNHGEQLAQQYLQKIGYKIIHSNWRYKRLEVDIIAKDQEQLVFVEVKARSNNNYGEPHTFVDIAKQRRLIQAAGAYIAQHKYQGEIRFDIVAVYFDGTGRIALIKDAFWSS